MSAKSSTSTEEMKLLMQISDLQQKVVFREKILKWLMYESLLTINSSYPLALMANKDINKLAKVTDNAKFNKHDINKMTNLALLCYRDSTAAAIYACMTVFKDHGEGGSWLSSEEVKEISVEMNKKFRDEFTDSNGDLSGTAHKYFSRTSVFGQKPGDSVDLSDKGPDTEYDVPGTENNSLRTKLDELSSKSGGTSKSSFDDLIRKLLS